MGTMLGAVPCRMVINLGILTLACGFVTLQWVAQLYLVVSSGDGRAACVQNYAKMLI